MVYVCPALKAFNRPCQFTISNGKRGKQMFHAVGGSWQLALADLDAKTCSWTCILNLNSKLSIQSV
jgi:hypothetical protein